MSPAENNVLEIQTRQADRSRAALGYKFQTAEEMRALPTGKDWLIKGVLARGESSGWIAPPGGMKSALLAEASICVAAGLDWHGYRNKEQCGVVYFALERADLVRRRILAHMARLGLKDLPIVIVKTMIDPKNANKIIATIEEAAAELGVTIGLVIFDTFAKLIAAGGGDENSAKDQGAVFATLQRVKDATRTHIAIIGHTGKDESKGWRGSNASLGDVDVMATISGDQTKTVEVSGNDCPDGVLFSFKSELHEFRHDEDGDPETVNVVSGDQPETLSPTARTPKLTKNQQTLFSMLHAAGSSGLTLEDWNIQAREAGIGVKRKADLNDIRSALLSKGLVRHYGDRWTVQHG